MVSVERGNDAVIVEGDAELVTDLDAELVERLLAAYRKYMPTHGYEAAARQLAVTASGGSGHERCSVGAHSRATRRDGRSTRPMNATG